MDVLEILINKLDQLPAGDHSSGLKAVRLHIEAAIRHFGRGQNDDDASAFTDSIYRCNQAFEGSVKEAYRVLASKNPEKMNLAEIEAFLTSGGVLRKKVLDQFTNYRKEWRNPSTHNYMLDFNEDEALLAIVSVTVFSIVLCDQIESKIAFLAAQSTAPVAPLSAGSLLDQVVEVVRRFPESYDAAVLPSPQATYERVEGALAGYLSAEFARHNVKVSQGVSVEGKFEVDVVVGSPDNAIAIELKVVRHIIWPVLDQALLKLTKMTLSGHFSGGVALLLSADAHEYEVVEPIAGNTTIKAVLPKRLERGEKT
jgi:hypothetical protein